MDPPDLDALLQFDPAEVAMYAARDETRFEQLEEFSERLSHYIGVLSNCHNAAVSLDPLEPPVETNKFPKPKKYQSRQYMQYGKQAVKERPRRETQHPNMEEPTDRKACDQERVQKKCSHHLKYHQKQARNERSHQSQKTEENVQSQRKVDQHCQKKFAQHPKYRQHERPSLTQYKPTQKPLPQKQQVVQANDDRTSRKNPPGQATPARGDMVSRKKPTREQQAQRQRYPSHHRNEQQKSDLEGRVDSKKTVKPQPSPTSGRGYLRRPVRHSLYLPQQQGLHQEESARNQSFEREGKENQHGVSKDDDDALPRSDSTEGAQRNLNLDVQEQRKAWLRQKAQTHLMRQQTPPKQQHSSDPQSDGCQSPDTLTGKWNKMMEISTDESSFEQSYDEDFENLLMVSDESDSEDGVPPPPILNYVSTQQSTVSTSKEVYKATRQPRSPLPLYPKVQKGDDDAGKKTFLFEPDPKLTTPSNASFVDQIPTSPRGSYISVRPDPPKGYNGTLAKSKLKHSKGLTLDRLNHRASKAGLCLSFSNTVIAKRGQEVSHLIFEHQHADLPYDEHQPLQWWVRIGQPRLAKVAPLDPVKYPLQPAIPIFWARHCYRVDRCKGGQKERIPMLHYVGHYRCVDFEKKTSAFKGRMSQAYLEFLFERYDDSMARVLDDEED